MDRFFIMNSINEIDYIYNEEDIKHISKVLRLFPSDNIEIVDSNDEEYICEIQEIAKEYIKFIVKEKVKIKRELEISINVYQGIPKGQKLDLIVQKLTEIGVRSITPIEFKRCVSSIKEEKEEKKILRLKRIVYEASKQSKRNRLLDINLPKSFDEMLEELKSNSLNIVFYESENSYNLRNLFGLIDLLSLDSVGLIIGPEGGIDIEEIEALKHINCNIITLGTRILRTETAAVVASAIVAYEIDNLTK